jgi:HEAT repeat protein
MVAGTRTALASSALTLLLIVAPAHAQAPASGLAQQEASTVAEGWAMLARGAIADAAGHAALALGRFPHSAAVLSLAVETEIARAGALAGLDQYERWLGSKAFEEPAILRRVARALLWDTANSTRPSRIEALRILANDGDGEALVALSARTERGSPAEARVLASIGDERGVKVLVASLTASGGAGASLETIRVLGESRHPAAFNALLAQARSPEPAVRQAAMNALGRFGDPRALAVLREGLKDQFGLVRGQAAGALYALGDGGGLGIIEELAGSESPMGRLAAARYMSSRPDARWLTLVRGLSVQGQPSDVRLAAAQLLAPHAPDEAAAILRALGSDTSVDLAVREEAVRAQPTALPNDMRALRDLLREPDDLVRLAVVERLLAMTR